MTNRGEAMADGSNQPSRPSHEAGAYAQSNGHRTLYRLNSNQSESSIFEEVEMAHEEAGNPPPPPLAPPSLDRPS
jgi:cation-transporting P-type ATPase 13A2